MSLTDLNEKSYEYCKRVVAEFAKSNWFNFDRDKEVLFNKQNHPLIDIFFPKNDLNGYKSFFSINVINVNQGEKKVSSFKNYFLYKKDNDNQYFFYFSEKHDNIDQFITIETMTQLDDFKKIFNSYCYYCDAQDKSFLDKEIISELFIPFYNKVNEDNKESIEKLNSKENESVTYLIGHTGVGKSTIYNLLRGKTINTNSMMNAINEENFRAEVGYPETFEEKKLYYVFKQKKSTELVIEYQYLDDEIKFALESETKQNEPYTIYLSVDKSNDKNDKIYYRCGGKEDTAYITLEVLNEKASHQCPEENFERLAKKIGKPKFDLNNHKTALLSIADYVKKRFTFIKTEKIEIKDKEELKKLGMSDTTLNQIFYKEGTKKDDYYLQVNNGGSEIIEETSKFLHDYLSEKNKVLSEKCTNYNRNFNNLEVKFEDNDADILVVRGSQSATIKPNIGSTGSCPKKILCDMPGFNDSRIEETLTISALFINAFSNQIKNKHFILTVSINEVVEKFYNIFQTLSEGRDQNKKNDLTFENTLTKSIVTIIKIFNNKDIFDKLSFTILGNKCIYLDKSLELSVTESDILNKIDLLKLSNKLYGICFMIDFLLQHDSKYKHDINIEKVVNDISTKEILQVLQKLLITDEIRSSKLYKKMENAVAENNNKEDVLKNIVKTLKDISNENNENNIVNQSFNKLYLFSPFTITKDLDNKFQYKIDKTDAADVNKVFKFISANSKDKEDNNLSLNICYGNNRENINKMSNKILEKIADLISEELSDHFRKIYESKESLNKYNKDSIRKIIEFFGTETNSINKFKEFVLSEEFNKFTEKNLKYYQAAFNTASLFHTDSCDLAKNNLIKNLKELETDIFERIIYNKFSEIKNKCFYDKKSNNGFIYLLGDDNINTFKNTFLKYLFEEGYNLYLMSENEFKEKATKNKNPILIKMENGGYKLWGNKDGKGNWEETELINFEFPDDWESKDNVYVSPGDSTSWDTLKKGHIHADSSEISTSLEKLNIQDEAREIKEFINYTSAEKNSIFSKAELDHLREKLNDIIMNLPFITERYIVGTTKIIGEQKGIEISLNSEMHEKQVITRHRVNQSIKNTIDPLNSKQVVSYLSHILLALLVNKKVSEDSNPFFWFSIAGKLIIDISLKDNIEESCDNYDSDIKDSCIKLVEGEADKKNIENIFKNNKNKIDLKNRSSKIKKEIEIKNQAKNSAQAKSIIIEADDVEVVDDVTIDVSGEDRKNDIYTCEFNDDQIKELHISKGQKIPAHGQHAGNIFIHAKTEFINHEKLTLISNGGKAGNLVKGSDGEKGKDADFKYTIDPDYTENKGSHHSDYIKWALNKDKDIVGSGSLLYSARKYNKYIAGKLKEERPDPNFIVLQGEKGRDGRDSYYGKPGEKGEIFVKKCDQTLGSTKNKNQKDEKFNATKNSKGSQGGLNGKDLIWERNSLWNKTNNWHRGEGIRAFIDEDQASYFKKIYDDIKEISFDDKNKFVENCKTKLNILIPKKSNDSNKYDFGKKTELRDNEENRVVFNYSHIECIFSKIRDGSYNDTFDILREVSPTLITYFDIINEIYCNLIHDKTDGYDLALMSDLPENDKTKAKNGIIYLSEDGNYVVRDPKEVLQESSLNAQANNIDLSQLREKLQDPNLKSAVLAVTSKAGHTQTDYDKICEILFFIYSRLYFEENYKDKEVELIGDVSKLSNFFNKKLDNDINKFFKVKVINNKREEVFDLESFFDFFLSEFYYTMYSNNFVTSIYADDWKKYNQDSKECKEIGKKMTDCHYAIVENPRFGVAAGEYNFGPDTTRGGNPGLVLSSDEIPKILNGNTSTITTNSTGISFFQYNDPVKLDMIENDHRQSNSK